MRLTANRWLSTVVPIQTWLGHRVVHGASRRTRWGRFVSNSQSRWGVRSISSHNLSRAALNPCPHSNTSAIDAQKTRIRLPARAAATFQRSGWAHVASLRKRLGDFAPHTSWPVRFAHTSA